jgi:transcriptional antiterminator NusG
MITAEAKTKNWYTIMVQNNRERTVSERLKSEMMREFNEEVNFLIPTQGVISVKDGKRVQKEQILYPGYIFVETKTIDKIDHLVKTTNGATNVLRDNKGTPIILKQSEVDRMIGEKEANKSAIMNTSFVVGEKIIIISGPFSKFKGTISFIDEEKDKVKVEVLIFGRATAVDLTLVDISKDNG